MPWIGGNWQLVAGSGMDAVVGALFAIGLLDEPVESAGATTLAMEALRQELARPVELASGEVGVAEVSVRVAPDTVGLEIAGTPATVARVWQRLPQLFGMDLFSQPVPIPQNRRPAWPHDLIARTGRNGGALTGLDVAAADVEHRARELLARFDPGAGRTPVVFCTSDEALVGVAYAVSEERIRPREMWAEYVGGDLATVKLAYRNSAGGNIVWYPYGRVPEN